MKLLTAALLTMMLTRAAEAQQPAPPTCDAPEHRQFDFWLGEWEVVDTAGRTLGRNVITSEQAGCVLHEHWTGAGGVTGESFNIWDRTTRQWHQTWVSATGSLLLLNGAWENGAIVMRGETRGADGRTQQQRITWSPQRDGTVVQHWEASADGTSWQTLFHGIYRKSGGAPGG